MNTKKRQYQTYLPDVSYYQGAIKCQSACPVRTDARGYVTAISRGEYERAYLIARENNPFASTCGWVCGAPCEAACNRGTLDAPISIRALKRFVNDQYGVRLVGTENAAEGIDWPAYTGPDGVVNLGNSGLQSSLTSLRNEHASATRRRVAVVGAGPSGLSCAHDLALLGHDVVIFEAAELPGGMLRLGVPEYRLPRQLIDLEIATILSLGPEMRLNQALGRDFSLADLRAEFDAIFIGIGTYQSRQLNVEGEDMDGVLRAVDFLLNVNLGGYNLDLGRKVIVIGGGNVAMDVARTAARLGYEEQQPSPEASGDLELALDVARQARRLGATEEVHCLVVEARHEMMADPIEIEEAQLEGVHIHNALAPSRIVGKEGRATGIEMLKVISTFDDEGRFNPQLAFRSEEIWECDSVIVAIGQSGELGWITPADGVETTPRGTLQVDPRTLATTAEGIFAGGDIAFGPRLIINAVADGQKAARGIHSYLTGKQPRLKRTAVFTPLDLHDYSDAGGPLPGWLYPQRQEPTLIPVERRVGVSIVEDAFTEAEARQQASRCLVCSITPVFDGNLCILCNGCVDVCPTDCLKLVSAGALDGDQQVSALFEQHAGDGTTFSAMLFEPARCIRCSLCAQRCPTDAITMETLSFTEEIVYE